MKVQRLGDVEIHKVTEIERLELDATWLLSNLTPERLKELGPELPQNSIDAAAHKVYLSFHSYVIKTKHHNILVDTCNGNDKKRPSMMAWDHLNLPYLETLSAAGFRPEDIDIVLCTHLHTDHVGWNTRLQNGEWVPTFPKARYLMSRLDFDVFHEMHKAGKEVSRGSFADSVLPIVDRGLAEFVDPGDLVATDLSDIVTLEDARGHSPGEININVSRGGRSACLCGDVVHHPIQCIDPILHNTSDYDPKQGMASRRRTLEKCADTDTMLLTAHFLEPTAGRVVSRGDTFRFKFED